MFKRMILVSFAVVFLLAAATISQAALICAPNTIDVLGLVGMSANAKATTMQPAQLQHSAIYERQFLVPGAMVLMRAEPLSGSPINLAWNDSMKHPAIFQVRASERQGHGNLFFASDYLSENVKHPATMALVPAAPNLWQSSALNSLAIAQDCDNDLALTTAEYTSTSGQWASNAAVNVPSVDLMGNVVALISNPPTTLPAIDVMVNAPFSVHRLIAYSSSAAGQAIILCANNVEGNVLPIIAAATVYPLKFPMLANSSLEGCLFDRNVWSLV